MNQPITRHAINAAPQAITQEEGQSGHDAGSASTDRIGAVLAERGARYGRFEDHAKVSGSLRSVIFGRLAERGVQLAPDQAEGIIMICHKLGRIANGDPDYADSWVDIAGYSDLVARRLEGNPT